MVAAAGLNTLKSTYRKWSTKKAKIDESFFDLYSDTVEFEPMAAEALR